LFAGEFALFTDEFALFAGEFTSKPLLRLSSIKFHFVLGVMMQSDKFAGCRLISSNMELFFD